MSRQYRAEVDARQKEMFLVFTDASYSPTVSNSSENISTELSEKRRQELREELINELHQFGC